MGRVRYLGRLLKNPVGVEDLDLMNSFSKRKIDVREYD